MLGAIPLEKRVDHITLQSKQSHFKPLLEMTSTIDSYAYGWFISTTHDLIQHFRSGKHQEPSHD